MHVSSSSHQAYLFQPHPVQVVAIFCLLGVDTGGVGLERSLIQVLYRYIFVYGAASVCVCVCLSVSVSLSLSLSLSLSVCVYVYVCI